MLRLGYHDEAHAFFWWLMHASRLTQPRLQVLYRLDGSEHARERELTELAGYRGSRPVRIGNGARDQVQLDVYGAVLEAIWLYAQAVGRLDGDTGKEVARIADYVAKHWRDKDNGIWEVRAERAHYIQSKGLCWVALDRACELGASGSDPRPQRALAGGRRRAQGLGGRARLGRGAPEPTCARRTCASSTPACSRWPCSGTSGERIDATIAAVERELREGPYVYRYRGDDGLAGEEGAFLTCSFWLVDAYARTGRLDDANALMDELVGPRQRRRALLGGDRPADRRVPRQLPAGPDAPRADQRRGHDRRRRGRRQGARGMTLWGALAGGAVGTIVLTSGLRVAQELGVTRMDIPLLLGTIFTDRRGRASVIGYVIHFVNGLVFALAYYGVFRAVGHAGWLFGAALGLVHACLAAGALLTVLLPGGAPADGHALDGRGGDAAARGAGLPADELRPPDGDLDADRPHRLRRDRGRLRRRPRLGVLDLEPEARQPLLDRAVERFLVLLGGLLVERRGEVVAQPGEDLGAVLDELLVVAEALLGPVALGPVVGALGGVAGLQQLEVVAHEEVELPRDHLGEAAPAQHRPRLARPVSLLVRTWNVFHGNASPPERHGFLEQMIRLATEDRPDVLCLQELPVWSLKRLGDWSGMQVFGAIAARPLLRSVALGRLTTAIHQGLFRSALTGQANAILLQPELRAVAEDSIVLNPLAFRRRISRRAPPQPADAREVGQGAARLPGRPHRGA